MAPGLKVYLARLVPDLGDECGGTRCADDAVTVHGRVQDWNKNAGLAAGVREDLQQLLLGNRHGFFPDKKYPLMAGGGVRQKLKTLVRHSTG